MQREDIALVGGIWRGGIREWAGMLQRYIQHTETAAQVKTFVQGYLSRVLVQFPFNDERRLPLAGVYFHNTVWQVAILHRRDACHHLHTLDVRCAYCTSGGAHGLIHDSIVVQAHTVYLDCRSKRCIAFLLRTASQTQSIVAHQRCIDRLTAWQEGCQITNIKYLLVVKRSAPYVIAGRCLILNALRRDGHTLKFQGFLLETEGQFCYVTADGHGPCLLTVT